MAIRKKTDVNKGGSVQMSFFIPECNWKPTPVSELPSWVGAKRISIDCETKDLDLKDLGPGPRRGGYTTGWAFKIEDGPKHYLPMRHEGGDNLPEEEVLRYLRHNLKNFSGEIVGANLSYDIDYAATDNIKFHPEVKFRDIQIADPLIYELHRSYSLKEIGNRWGVQGKESSIMEQAARATGLDPWAGMWRLPARYVGEYAENDVDAPLKIYEKQRERISKEELWKVFDLESKLLPILVKMRQRGIRIDFKKLEEIERWSLKEETESLQLVKLQTGVRVEVGEVWKPKIIARALTEIGVRLGKTTTGAPQIDKELLEGLDHPVAKAILHARKVNKIRTTFAASIRRYSTNGRIHCTFNQIAREDESGDQKGVRYGRLSATDPNLQQQPSMDRDPMIAGEWRKIFLAEEGAVFGVNDFSQQEPRWTTHFAALLNLPKAQEAARRYRDNPLTDNHEMMTRLIHGDEQVDAWKTNDPKLFKVNRGYSKNIFLGLCYGEGGAKLCQDIGKPTRWALIKGFGTSKEVSYFETRTEAWRRRSEDGIGTIREVAGLEGQNILDRFDEEVPYVRAVARAASARAESVGYVKTIAGRRLHFEQRPDGSYDWTHKTLNRVIQGSSADQTKQAVIDMDEAGYFIQLQVHDENDGSYATVADAKAAGQIMRESVLKIVQPLVPFVVDTEVGPSWGELKAA